MNWSELGLGVVISTVQALLLWLLLPRGVVLKRTPLSDIRDGTYGPVEDRWLIRNESSVAARIVSVTLLAPSGPSTPELAEGGPLELDDEIAELSRTDRRDPWSEVTIPPGDALVAHVVNNRDIEIQYRRAGWAGVLERRRIKVSGVV